MLKRPTPSPLQWMSSLLLAIVVTAATGYLAWAAQPAAAPELIEQRVDDAGTDAAGSPTQAAAAEAPDASQTAAPTAASVLPWSERSPPRYPVEAARQGVGGSVLLLVTVGADGSVREVQVEKSTPQGVFDAVSIEAARQWRFNPEMRDGQAVEGGQVRVPITFETDPQPSADAAKG